jgi:hypothetical protein
MMKPPMMTPNIIVADSGFVSKLPGGLANLSRNSIVGSSL